MAENLNSEEPRVLEYRKHIVFASNGLKYFSYFLFVILIYFIFLYFFHHFAGSKSAGEYLVGAFFIAIMATIFYLEYKYLFRPLATSKIQVFHDHIVIRRNKQKIIIPFSEITKVDGSAQVLLGGWFKLVLKNGKAYRFTIALERSDCILDAIIAFNPNLMVHEKYINLRTKLILIDHDWARYYSYFGKKYRHLTALYFLILPLGFMTILFIQQDQHFIIRKAWIFYLLTFFKIYIPIYILMILTPTVINTVINKKIKIHLRQNPKNKMRDLEYENLIHRKIIPVCFVGLFSFFALVYHFDLNFLYFTRPIAEVPHLQIRPSQAYIDTRFNCLKCTHPLKPDDRIAIRKGNKLFLGRIVGVPGEVMQINNRNTDGRYIASTEEIKIPEGKVAVRVTPDGAVLTLVDIEQIHGRLYTDLSDFFNPR